MLYNNSPFAVDVALTTQACSKPLASRPSSTRARTPRAHVVQVTINATSR